MIKVAIITFIQFTMVMTLSVAMLYSVVSHGDYKQGIVKLLN